MKKIYYTWSQVEGAVLDIARQLQQDNWKPDYIVGITRGGLIPANLLSQYTGAPLQTLKVQLRDGGESESNLWMAEDAFGYVITEAREYEHIPYSTIAAKNILIVDDINDEGNTIAWIKQDWQSGCLPGDERWDHIWGQNVRIATLTNNLASKQEVDYSVWEVNKAEENCWLVYPWEEFWL